MVLTSLGCSTKPEDLEVMLKEADLDSDGKINYEDRTLSPFEHVQPGVGRGRRDEYRGYKPKLYMVINGYCS